jgi:hypothetical protein
MRQGILDVLEDAEKSFWFWSRKETKYSVQYKLRPLPLLMLNPVSNVALALLLFGVGSIHVTRHEQVVSWLGIGFWQSFVLSGLFHLGLAISFGLFALSIMVGAAASGAATTSSLSDRVEKWQQQRRLDRERKQADEKVVNLANLERELERMACTTGAMPVSVGALPKDKQTFSLRFQATKKKVCRPFAR